MKTKLKEKMRKLVKDDMYNAIIAYNEVGWLPEPKNVNKIIKAQKKEIRKKIMCKQFGVTKDTKGKNRNYLFLEDILKEIK